MGEKKKERDEGDKAHRLRAYYPSKISDIAYVTSALPRAGLCRAEPPPTNPSARTKITDRSMHRHKVEVCIQH